MFVSVSIYGKYIQYKKHLHVNGINIHFHTLQLARTPQTYTIQNLCLQAVAHIKLSGQCSRFSSSASFAVLKHVSSGTVAVGKLLVL